MAGKYDNLARSILENVGGAENVTSVAHCITRVRFKLKDESRANTPKIEALKGVIQVIQANGQYQVVVGNIVEDVYDAVLEAGGLAGGGSAAEDEPEGEKTVASVIIDLISGIFQPILGPLAAAGIMKGLLALFTYFVPDFANDGLYTLLYTVADGFFYFLPVALAFSAARKFRMNEFTGVAIGVALVYPTMVALTSGEVLGSIDLGVAGTFSWYATALGIPIIMPASGYASSVIPVLLMVWFGSLVERWLKGWMPAALKMFLVPLATMTVSIVLGYLVIGPVATLITNLLSAAFSFIFQLPVVGAVLGSALVGGLWMCLVIFGFHWSLIPISIMNLNTLDHDYVLAATIGHGFALGAVIFAMYLRNRDERFRGIALPAMISAFFFGVTEPGIYGVALPNKRAFVVACLSSAVGGAIVGATNSLMYISGGLGVFSHRGDDGRPHVHLGRARRLQPAQLHRRDAGRRGHHLHGLRNRRLARLGRHRLRGRVRHLPARPGGGPRARARSHAVRARHRLLPRHRNRRPALRDPRPRLLLRRDGRGRGDRPFRGDGLLAGLRHRPLGDAARRGNPLRRRGRGPRPRGHRHGGDGWRRPDLPRRAGLARGGGRPHRDLLQGESCRCRQAGHGLRHRHQLG